jgi:uncharacterized protein
MKRLALTAIKLYQKTRNWRQPTCRFYPSCSSYAYQSIDKHGLGKGLLLSAGRVCRCHPLHDGGIDEVPEKFRLSSIFCQSPLTESCK